MLRSALLTALIVLAIPAAVLAQTPQTISLDGTNDFDPLNLIEADGGDTEHAPLDIGGVYVTNDAVNLFIGVEHDQADWDNVQVGIAIDVGTPEGGDTDPWGRKLEWSLAANKPDFIFYVNLDNDWQDMRVWDDGWVENSGPGSQGWVAGEHSFKELGILLNDLGVAAGDPLNIEVWITQDGVDKGPLDAAANDASQLSVEGGPTIWETPSAIPMFDYLPYTVQGAVDNDPPQVSGALHLVDSEIDVAFTEPVDPVTGAVAGNYSVSGATVTAASVDGADVTLTLSADIDADADLYTVTVTGVEDLAGNVIAGDNTACFMVKNVLFRGRMSYFLSGQTEPYGGFTVEGDVAPLSWSLCDGMDAAHVGDGVYEVAADFCVAGDCGAGTAEASVQWKWVYDCGTYEPVDNRGLTLSLDGESQVVLDVWWNDQDPTQFITHDIDVEFFVDMNVYGYAMDDTVAMNGSAAPLNWNVPSDLELVDDGTGNDAQAGDGVFSALVTFPAGSEKNVTYKFLLNSDYECSTQGDRTVFLNDELFDTVGGALGPLTLPVVHFDRCTATWRGVEVIFRMDGEGHVLPGDLVAVNGTPSNSETPSFSWDIPSLNVMADDGVAPDESAGDGIWTCAVVFADSSNIFTEYKYLVNGEYECADLGNRSFDVDADYFDDAGTPQILAVDDLHHCVDTSVDTPDRLVVEDLRNAPNPFNPLTEIRFTVHRAGRGSLRVFNVKGEMVRTLHEGRFELGEHAVSWDGTDGDGSRAATGAYFYRLEVNGESSVRKMLLLK